jgi:hypothetical protein
VSDDEVGQAEPSGDAVGDSEASGGVEATNPVVGPPASTTAVAPVSAGSGQSAGRRLVPFSLVGILTVGAAVAATLAVVGSTSAAATLASAASNSIATHSADVTLNLDGTVDGQNITMTGNGPIDFDTNESSMTMHINLLGSQETLSEIYDGKTVFLNIGDLLGKLNLGKSWVSVPIGQVKSASSSLPGAGASDPTALLHLLTAQGNTVTALGPSDVDGHTLQEYSVAITPQSLARDIAQAHLPSWMASAVSLVHNAAETEKVGINSANELQSVASTVTATIGGQKLVETVTQEFSNYGVPVTITDPPSNEVLPFSALLQIGQGDPSVT